jgi:hypothetical protein
VDLLLLEGRGCTGTLFFGVASVNETKSCDANPNAKLRLADDDDAFFRRKLRKVYTGT